jgi:hypothetical protein
MVEVSVSGGRVGFVVGAGVGLGEDADGFGVLGLVVALDREGVVRVVDDGGWLDVVDEPAEDVVAAPPRLPVVWPSGGVQATIATEHMAAVAATVPSRPLTLI